MKSNIQVDLDVEDRWGNTPLQDAVRCSHPRIVAMLKKFRAVSGVPLMSTLSEEPSSPTKVGPPNFQEQKWIVETDQACPLF